MTYIELLNSFWEAYRVKKFSDIDTAIYFFLLNECNIRRWLNPFELQTRNIEVVIGVSRKTIGEARNRLKQRGVIDFVVAQGRAPTTYLIEGADITNDLLRELFCVSRSASPRKHKGNTRVTQMETQGLHKGNTTADSTLYKEEIRYKNKDISPDGDIARAREEHSLFEEEEKKNQKSKTTPRPKPPEPLPPTFDEVKAYFLSQRADERLEDWERETEIFFNHFTSLGWKTSSGAKVSRWDSRANLWIIEHEKKPTTEKPKTDEAGKADKLSERRGSDSGAKSRKGFKGTF